VRALLIAAALLLAACPKNAPPSSTEPEAPAPENPKPEVGPNVGPGSVPDSQGGKMIGQILLPPTTPGDSKSEVTGCLAAATEAEGAKFAPPPENTRGMVPAPAVKVDAIAGGIIVSHDLSHACCLRGTVTSKLDKEQVTVREVLSGTPCRCMCRSTLRTAVGLKPGDYKIHVTVEENGKERTPVDLTATVIGPIDR
jgi:hypothetical protein